MLVGLSLKEINPTVFWDSIMDVFGVNYFRNVVKDVYSVQSEAEIEEDEVTWGQLVEAK